MRKVADSKGRALCSPTNFYPRQGMSGKQKSMDKEYQSGKQQFD